MAGKMTNVCIRMDADLKARADELYAELGMNLSTAFNIFVRQSLRGGGLPFIVKTNRPNLETIQAMFDAKRIAADSASKRFANVEETLKELKEV